MTDIREGSFWSKLFEKLLAILGKGLGGKRKSQKHQHVVTHEDGWAVRGEGNQRVTAVYDYQDDAIERAKEIAENYGADVIIHGRDGRIRDCRSYPTKRKISRKKRTR